MQDGKVISNRFAKACVTCQQMVKKDEGYAKNQNGMWHTYCQNCLIVPKTYSIQQSNSDNITEDGKVYFSYSTKKVEAVKSLPHSVWIPSEKCWKVSIRPEHISRVVEVCKNLGFNITKLSSDYVEFRYAGGDIPKEVLIDKVKYCAFVVYCMTNPEYKKREYTKKLYKFIDTL